VGDPAPPSVTVTVNVSTGEYAAPGIEPAALTTQSFQCRCTSRSGTGTDGGGSDLCACGQTAGAGGAAS
jgi:hypothetical protein